MNVERMDDTCHVTTQSAEETRHVGRVVGRQLRPGDVVLLFGDLGAGKTTLVQGLGAAIGAEESVTSPTFTLIHVYHGEGVMLVHFDPYRLAGPEDVEGTGFLDYLGLGAILAVEWAERLGELAPRDAVNVHIDQADDDDRTIRIEWNDPRLAAITSDLETAS